MNIFVKIYQICWILAAMLWYKFLDFVHNVFATLGMVKTPDEEDKK